jgi:uncharacterized protein YdaU (DUF1376 family)
MNYYPFHIGDYVSHTSHLSDAEDLAYRRMIDLYYQSEQPFVDINFIARRVKSTPEIISVILSDFFVKSEDGWRNKRADEEISKYHAKAESARNANKAKIQKKSELITELKSTLKSELKSEPNQDATKNQEPITNISTPTPKKASPKKKPIPDNFGISERVRDWATKKGFKNLEEHFEYFVDKCNQKGYLNVDWDLAFMNAIRDDWAKINISKTQTEYDPFKGAI